MKNNRGVTLVALVVIIVLLLVFAVVAIYTSIDSYKIIDIQRYKAQMQLIQSAVDEFYEEFESAYERRDELAFGSDTKEEFMEKYVKAEYQTQTGVELKNIWDQKDAGEPVTSWWDESKFGISITNLEIQKQYYYFTKDMVEDFLGVSDINISEGFIINFQKRYVFSETPIYVNDTDEKIYSLYQLNEEEKVIEFKVNSTNGIGRSLYVDIIDVKNDYQKIKMRMDNTQGETGVISEVYFKYDTQNIVVPDNSSIEEFFVNKITEDSKFEEISGINTKELTMKINSEGKYMFRVVDSLGNEYYSEFANPISIKFHEPPVLENNLIPFIPEKDNIGNQIRNKGIVYPKEGHDDKNEWYNYSQGRYATAVISNDEYEKNKGKTFDINQSDVYVLPDGTGAGTHIVKVWIPKKLARDILESNYDGTKFINKTGIWVTASWDEEEKVWIPDEGKFETEVESFSKTELNINLISTSNLKYYWKKNNESDYQDLPGNTLTVTATNNIKEEVKSISIYGRAVNGNTTQVQTVRLKEENISSYNLLRNASGFENSGWGIGNTITYDGSVYRSGRYSLKLGGDTSAGEVVSNSVDTVDLTIGNMYYISLYGKKQGTYDAPIGFYLPLAEPSYRLLDSGISDNGWIKYSIRGTRQNYTHYYGDTVRVDNDNAKNDTTIWVDDVLVVDLTEKFGSGKEPTCDWCDTFIDTKDGETVLYYYE